jgi:hypothetical protein
MVSLSPFKLISRLKSNSRPRFIYEIVIIKAWVQVLWHKSNVASSVVPANCLLYFRLKENETKRKWWKQRKFVFVEKSLSEFFSYFWVCFVLKNRQKMLSDFVTKSIESFVSTFNCWTLLQKHRRRWNDKLEERVTVVFRKKLICSVLKKFSGTLLCLN